MARPFAGREEGDSDLKISYSQVGMYLRLVEDAPINAPFFNNKVHQARFDCLQGSPRPIVSGLTKAPPKREITLAAIIISAKSWIIILLYTRSWESSFVPASTFRDHLSHRISHGAFLLTDIISFQIVCIYYGCLILQAFS